MHDTDVTRKFSRHGAEYLLGALTEWEPMI